MVVVSISASAAIMGQPKLDTPDFAAAILGPMAIDTST
ncbi:hypothetical protein Maes01_02396 [Microbulbifer aestuariivivens]|uniref:Uncharacterized protein n=1 Tax=Microbulbifer aestuariivivens TaxID=1908308 RepID=A0ABP9WTA4_9GAMM